MKIYLLTICLLAGIATAQPLYPHFEWYRPKDSLVFNRAYNLYQLSKFADAKKELLKLPSRLYKNEAGWLRLLGYCYFGLGNYDKAIDVFGLSMATNPEYIGTYSDRGSALMEAQKFRSAASDFAAYAIHYPQDRDVAIDLAYCLAEDHQTIAATEYLERFQPKDTSFYMVLSSFYIDYKVDTLKGIESLEKALLIDPNYPRALETLSNVYHYISNCDKAIKLINTLIDLKPDYGRAYYLRAIYLYDMGMQIEAQESLDLAEEKGYTSWDEEEYYEDDN